MKKSPGKKGGRSKAGMQTEAHREERRRHSRNKREVLHPEVTTTRCGYCQVSLTEEGKALFVEEEVGRVFCSEDCISQYFAPDIERLEQEYLRVRPQRDLDSDARVALAHLRWITLEEPDEIWREKTLAGDYRYTLISEFTPEDKPIWCICICLFLRGDPSFLFIAFPSQSESLVQHYRRGERVERMMSEGDEQGYQTGTPESGEEPSDRLAKEWTREESLRAESPQSKKSGKRVKDIPPSDFAAYSGLMDETLESPDEVWSHPSEADPEIKMFHFIKHYADQDPAIWYIIVAKETEDNEQIEICDSFPTRNSEVVHGFRRGLQEVGSSGGAGSTSGSQLIH